MTALMRFSYVTRFGTGLIRGDAATTHMQQCAQLSATSKICELQIPDDLTRLPDAVRLVEHQLMEGFPDLE
jgi:hypothetical protein